MDLTNNHTPIKLIIWDLDECLWNGTLSEGDVTVPDSHVSLLKGIADCGIVNSICSKNEHEKAKGVLLDYGVWDLFVFPSISWDAKGPRLKEMLKGMAIRPENTLFIDDNPSNRGEAEYYVPGISTAGPEVVPELILQVTTMEKRDSEHRRLQDYRILEKRNQAAETFTDSEKFLYDSDIRVTIHHDCACQKARILELIGRTNQLNFTKKRIGSAELDTLLADPSVECGYVSSEDRYGDYGIVGFYALREGRLEHFAFSCRTMGQRIEQWVYAQLGFPEVTEAGEVATHLNSDDCPGWINQDMLPEREKPRPAAGGGCRVLLKGPCDLSHSLVYLKDTGIFEIELGYTTPEGKVVAAHNHSVQIEGLHTYSEQDRHQIAEECIFVDPPMLSGSFFTGAHDLIVLSTSFEAYYRIYRRKGSGVKVAFAGVDLTNPKYWPGLISGELYTGGNHFTEEYLEDFAEKYEYIGVTRPENYVAFLEHCLEWLPKETRLCLLLGAARSIDGADVIKLRRSALNSAVMDFAKSHTRISYIEIDRFIHDPSDFIDGFNHFSARVYYEISQAIAREIRELTGAEVKSYSPAIVRFDSMVLRTRKRLTSFLKPGSVLYAPLKKLYDCLYKHRT